jgi:hypothetical protein
VLLNIGCTSVNEQEHPRIYCDKVSKPAFLESLNKVEWKKQLVEDMKTNLEPYLKLCKDDPDWLVSRLQMNWKTKHDKVYFDGVSFSYSAGSAPVPTVRFSGSRDWATDYSPPLLEELEPYLDDERGIYLKNKKTGEMEWVHPSKTGHIIEGINRRIMNLVQDAAFLYWLTGDKKYAEFAEPVFFTYIDGMYYREPPIDLEKENPKKVVGLASFEVIHEQIVIYLTSTYDFLYPYFKKNNNDLTKVSAVFQKWGDQIIKHGIPDNNWNLFQARFLTYIALALDKNENYQNGKGQEYYLKHTFDESTERQIALKESILVYDQKNGIWPESPSYSVHVTTSLLQILTLLDNVSNKNELSNFPIIEKAALAAFQYLFPSGYTIAFGDAKHQIIPPENFELLIANYRKYGQKDKELVMSGLLNQLIEKGDYQRKGNDLFQLFFYVDTLEKCNSEILDSLSSSLISPTFYAPNVSLFIQRMGRGDDAMMVSTVGSFGNHSHTNGIAMELFANNYVLGPDMSKGPSYWHPDHRDYYSQFPAHNTVVVDGASTYGSMRGYHPYTLENNYPKVGANTNQFDKITYSMVSFVEPETMSDQQRLTAIIKSASGKPYMLDIFRSRKKNGSSQKHEYFYHNLGQSLEIFDENNKQLKFSPTNELGTQHGDLKAYDYLTDKYSLTSSENIQALFTLRSKDQPDNRMKMWIKGSKNQKIFSVKAPKSNALSKGTAPAEMLGAEIPTIVLRRDAEAWSNPFAIVFNPYIDERKNPISNVDFPVLKGNYEAQKIQLVHDDGITKDMIIANASVNDIAFENSLYQKGLLSVIRFAESASEPKFIFVSGMYKFVYYDWEILSVNKALTVSIERDNDKYIIQNDKPCVIKVPLIKGNESMLLELYENDKLVTQRKGFPSRSNPNQVEFRLSKAYDKAIVVAFD